MKKVYDIVATFQFTAFAENEEEAVQQLEDFLCKKCLTRKDFENIEMEARQSGKYF